MTWCSVPQERQESAHALRLLIIKKQCFSTGRPWDVGVKAAPLYARRNLATMTWCRSAPQESLSRCVRMRTQYPLPCGRGYAGRSDGPWSQVTKVPMISASVRVHVPGEPQALHIGSDHGVCWTARRAVWFAYRGDSRERPAPVFTLSCPKCGKRKIRKRRCPRCGGWER